MKGPKYSEEGLASGFGFNYDMLRHLCRSCLQNSFGTYSGFYIIAPLTLSPQSP